MSQAKRESSEEAVTRNGVFALNQSTSLRDLYEEIQQRVSMVDGFLSMLAVNTALDDSSTGRVTNAAWGNLELLQQADLLLGELHRRLVDLERPQREAAAKRERRDEIIRRLTDAAVRMGQDRKTARKIARECLAAQTKEERDAALSGNPATGH